MMPRPRCQIQRRLSKRSLLSVGEGGNAGDAAAQNAKYNIQRRLSKISLLSVGEGGNAGDAAAQNERVNVVRALVRVHRLQVHHVSACGHNHVEKKYLKRF